MRKEDLATQSTSTPAAPLQPSTSLFPKAKAVRSVWEMLVCCACCCCSPVAREEDEAIDAILNEWSARLNSSTTVSFASSSTLHELVNEGSSAAGANAYDVIALADCLRSREGGSFGGTTHRHQKTATDAAVGSSVAAFQREDHPRPHRGRSLSLHRYAYNQQEMQRLKRANREKMMRDFAELEELFSGTNKKDLTNTGAGLAPTLPKSKSKTQGKKGDLGEDKSERSTEKRFSSGREKSTRFFTPADELNEDMQRKNDDHFSEKDYLMRSLSFGDVEDEESDDDEGSTDSGISDVEGHYSMLRAAEMLERKRRQRIRQAEVEQGEASRISNGTSWAHRPLVDDVLGTAAAKGPLSTQEARKVGWVISEQEQGQEADQGDSSSLLFTNEGESRRGSQRRSSASVDSAELQTGLDKSSMGRYREVEVAPSYFTTSPLYRATFKAAFANAFTSTDKSIRSPHRHRRASKVDLSYLDGLGNSNSCSDVSRREKHQQPPKRLKPLFASQLRTEVQERFASSSSIANPSARKGNSTSNAFRSSAFDEDDLLPDVLPPPKSVIIFEYAHKIQPLQKL